MTSTTLAEDQASIARGMISEMELAFQSGVESGQIPGAVVMAKDLTGTLSSQPKRTFGKILPVIAHHQLTIRSSKGALDYVRCFGARSFRPDEHGRLPPMEVNTIMRMGQATALVGIVMALQCVDRGLVSLDESVERLLPDLTSMEVLAGFDAEGKPVMRERNGIITLRLVPTTSHVTMLKVNDLTHLYFFFKT